jgi:hypothetical protein
MVKNSTEYMKTYYNNNKQKYAEEYNVKVKCELCNHEYPKLNFNKHIKSKKHTENESKSKHITIPIEMYSTLIKMVETEQMKSLVV